MRILSICTRSNIHWVTKAVVRLLSPVWLFLTPWTAAHPAPLSYTISQILLKLMSIELVILSKLLIFCHPHSPSFAFNISQHQGLPMSQVFTSGGQSMRPSALTSILPMNIQGWFPLGLTGLIIVQSKGLSRILSSTTVLLLQHQFFSNYPSLWSKSHIRTWLLEKTYLWLYIHYHQNDIFVL